MTRPRLFLIDDNHGDGMLLDLAFSDAGKAVDITQVHDGATALDHLRNALRVPPFPFHLIIVDLNLPRIDGMELLERLQTWPELALVPIVILTSSPNPVDRLRSLEVKPLAFLVKPDDFRGLAEVVERLSVYLFPTVDLAAGQASLA